MYAVTNIARDMYSPSRLGFLFLQLYACVSRHYTLDGAIGIELHFVDAYLAVNTWLEMDVFFVDAMVDDIPIVGARNLDNRIVGGAIDFVLWVLD